MAKTADAGHRGHEAWRVRLPEQAARPPALAKASSPKPPRSCAFVRRSGSRTTRRSPDAETALCGSCPSMLDVYKAIGRVAAQDVTVLITGESGTGKELVARAIYQHSGRSKAPFLALNCAAIPRGCSESELFGHEKGAFTGADRRRIGKFEQVSRWNAAARRDRRHADSTAGEDLAATAGTDVRASRRLRDDPHRCPCSSQRLTATSRLALPTNAFPRRSLLSTFGIQRRPTAAAGARRRP